MVEKLIRCRQCNQVMPVDRIFAGGDLPAALPGVVWSDEDTTFRREFVFAHGNHPQEELRIDPETIFSEKPGIEPVKISYCEASNGSQKFLIKRTKPGLEHPARYEILPGQMEISAVAIQIQDADIRRQVAADRTLPLLSPERISEFLAAFSEEIAAIHPHHFLDAAAATAEGDSPRFVYASLNQERWEKILGKCARNFQPAELDWIREFIRNHGAAGEVLSLVVYRRVSFLPASTPVPANPEISPLHP
jgi:hypothetical protein